MAAIGYWQAQNRYSDSLSRTHIAANLKHAERVQTAWSRYCRYAPKSAQTPSSHPAYWCCYTDRKNAKCLTVMDLRQLFRCHHDRLLYGPKGRREHC